jgi:hypothetical protein
MTRPTRVNRDGESRQRISDELRQLKQMSKGLRTKALRALMERGAAKRLAARPLLAEPIVANPIVTKPALGQPIVLPAKASVAA